MATLQTTPVPSVRVLWRPEQFNRISNPGFETNTTGWAVTAGVNAAGTSITRITSDSHAGSACALLVCGTTDGGGVHYDFGSDRFYHEAAAGAMYAAVVWLKRTSGSHRARLILGSEGTSSDRATLEITLVDEWRPYVVRWLPSGARTDVQLAITNGSTQALSVQVDDVNVYLVDAFSQVENGTFEENTTGWAVVLSGTISQVTASPFGGSANARIVTSSSQFSGADYDLGYRLFTSGRTYRLRLAMRSISGSTSVSIGLGSVPASDRGTSTKTLTTSWVWYTVDWTPSANRTDASVQLRNTIAATNTFEVDEVEAYEAADDLNVQYAKWNRGSTSDGFDSPGSIAVQVNNHDGEYDPRNTAAELYGSLEPGRRIWGRATYGNVLYPLFYGTVKTIEGQARDDIHADILGEDILAELGKASVSHDFGAADTYEYARRATHAMVVQGITDLVGITTVLGTSRRDTTTLGVESNTFFNGTDGTTNALDYLSQLNEATGTVHFCQPSVHANIGYRYTTVDRATLTDDSSDFTVDEDFEDLTGIRSSAESLENRQEVSWQGYDLFPPPTHAAGFGIVAEAYDPTYFNGNAGDEAPYLNYLRDEYGSDADAPEARWRYHTPLWYRKRRIKRGLKIRRRTRIYPEALVPFSMAVGEVREFVVDFAVPMSGLRFYVYNSSGSRYTNSITTLYREIRPQRLVVELRCVTASTVNRVAVYGTPWLPGDDISESVVDYESELLRGHADGPSIGTPYIPSRGMAVGLGEYRNWRYSSPRLRPRLQDHNTFTRVLTTDVTDHVTLSADRWRIASLLHVVRACEWEVTQGGLEWRAWHDLEELPTHTDWIILNDATRGLNDPAVLAY